MAFTICFIEDMIPSRRAGRTSRTHLETRNTGLCFTGKVQVMKMELIAIIVILILPIQEYESFFAIRG